MNKAGCISFISGCGKPKYLLFKLLFSGKNLKVFFVCLFFPLYFIENWLLRLLLLYLVLIVCSMFFNLQEIQEEMKKHGHEPVKFLDVKVMIKREDGFHFFP